MSGEAGAVGILQRKPYYGSLDDHDGRNSTQDQIYPLESTIVEKTQTVSNKTFEAASEYRMSTDAFKNSRTAGYVCCVLGVLSWAVAIAGIILNIYENMHRTKYEPIKPLHPIITYGFAQGSLCLGIGIGRLHALEDAKKIETSLVVR